MPSAVRARGLREFRDACWTMVHDLRGARQLAEDGQAVSHHRCDAVAGAVSSLVGDGTLSALMIHELMAVTESGSGHRTCPVTANMNCPEVAIPVTERDF
jgi:hypothetical protein